MTGLDTTREVDPRLDIHIERAAKYRELLGAGVTALEATVMVPRTPQRGIVFEEIPEELRQVYLDLAAHYL